MHKLNAAGSTAASLPAKDIQHLVSYIERATGTIEMEYTDYRTAIRSLCQVVREQNPQAFTPPSV